MTDCFRGYCEFDDVHIAGSENEIISNSPQVWTGSFKGLSLIKKEDAQLRTKFTDDKAGVVSAKSETIG